MPKYLEAIVLRTCSYCSKLVDLMNDKNIKVNYNYINSDEKEKYKDEIISTFPQVYLVVNKKKLLIGGYDTMRNVFDILSSKNLDIIKKELKQLYLEWSDRNILRLIKLLN